MHLRDGVRNMADKPCGDHDSLDLLLSFAVPSAKHIEEDQGGLIALPNLLKGSSAWVNERDTFCNVILVID